MIRLLKADFYRLFKNRLVLIGFIAAAVLPLFLCAIVLLVRFLFGLIGESYATEAEAMLNARVIISTSFSFSNNFGIILPLFATLVIMSDISSGGIRNKIIAGHKRHEIYFSHFMTTLVYCLLSIAIYAAMTALWAILFLGPNSISGAYVVSYVYFYLLGFAGYIFVASITTSMSLMTLNTPAAIVLTLALCFAFGMVPQFIGLIDYSPFEHAVSFIPNFVVAMAQMKPEITPVMLVEGLAGTALFAGAFYVAGVMRFNKRDLR